MAGNPEMKKIFIRAVAIAKELREKNPKLSAAESTKKAWATPEIKKMMEEYRAKKGKAGSASKKKEGKK
jgi:hypothetical protein